MQRTRSGFLMLAVTASMLLWASIAVTPAKADVVTFSFEGVVDTIGSNLLGNSSALGTQGGAFESNPIFLSGSYKFNTGIGSVAQPSSNVSVYSNTITDFHFTLHGGAQSLNYSNTNAPNTIAPLNTIAVGNGAATPGAGTILGFTDPNPATREGLPLDSYQVVTSFSGNDVNGIGGPVTASHLEFNYIHNNIDHPGGPFSDTSLPTLPPSMIPTLPPSVNGWMDAHSLTPFRVVFGTGDDASLVNGRILSMNLVANPLPPAVILFGAGLVALIGLGAGSWRQRKTA